MCFFVRSPPRPDLHRQSAVEQSVLCCAVQMANFGVCWQTPLALCCELRPHSNISQKRYFHLAVLCICHMSGLDPACVFSAAHEVRKVQSTNSKVA